MLPMEEMSLMACVVKCRLPGLEDECSNCGTFLLPRQGLILSHGTLLLSLLSHDKQLKTKINNGQFVDRKSLQDCDFSVLLDKKWLNRTEQSSHQIEMRATSLIRHESQGERSSHLAQKCHFLGAFRNWDFHTTLASLMPESNWKLTDGTSEKSVKVSHKDSSSTDLEYADMAQLMSYFVLLKTDPATLDHSECVDAVDPLLLSRVAISPGDVAELVATPFGGLSPGVFFNSFSRGVVSNVSGPEGCWILTDARCIPGSEGAPLFTRSRGNSKRSLTGVVAASLCWKNSEWVGFSVVCGLSSILRCVGREPALMAEWRQGSTLELPKLLNHNNYLFKDNWLLALTVLVQVGSTWGSGVVVDRDEGFVLTCSHVVKDAAEHCVFVSSSFYDSEQLECEVVYRQTPLTGPLDVAVLRCRRLREVTKCHFTPGLGRPSVGDRVFAVGHAVFDRRAGLKPSVSAGVISKVISSTGQPVMIQSTCAVHPGASGGPLFSHTGHLLGVLTCNTRDQTSGATHPHVNMSVPAGPVCSLLQQYKHTKDKTIFSKLQLKSPWVKDLWNLGNSENNRAIQLRGLL